MNLYKVFIQNTNQVREFVPYDDNYNNQMTILRQHPQYESIFLYEDKHLEYYKNNKNAKGNSSLAGITGLYTDKVVFDFDSKNDQQKALNDARLLVARLQQFISTKTAIRCFFSGSKGYHVEIQFKKGQYISQEEFEAIIKYYAGNLETFDSKIKDPQRVFRFPLSKHPTSGNYKLPISLDHFTNTQYNHEYIYNVAKALDTDQEVLDSAISTIASFGTIDYPEEFVIAVEKFNKKSDSTIDKEVISQEFPDMDSYNRSAIKILTPAKHCLSLGFFDEGERNSASMILAASYKYIGYTKDQAYELIKIAVNSRNERLGLGRLDDNGKSELWNTVMETVYSTSWNGATYSDLTDPLLQKTIEKYNLEQYYNPTSNTEVLTISDVGQLFLKFADEIDNNRILTGITELDNNIMLTSSMMVGILGAPSSGKSSMALNTLEFQSINGIHSFLMSSDMAPQLLYASLLRRYCKKSFKEILDTVKKVKMDKWPKEMKDAWDIVQDRFKNVGMCFKSGPTIEDIKQQIDIHEQKTGISVKFFVMDYLEKMQSKYSDATATSGYNAARLADLTRDKNLTTFLLLQTQKAAGDPSDELLTMRNIKGASVIEQDCRVVLTTWRVGFNPDVKGFNPDDKFVSMACVKNNMGSTGRFDFYVDPKSGLYRSLNDEEIVEFEEVKRKAIERKFNKIRAKSGLNPSQNNGTSTINRFPTKINTSPFLPKNSNNETRLNVLQAKKPTIEPEQKIL